jgi:flagellar hook-associated protein 3 FlgL
MSGAISGLAGYDFATRLSGDAAAVKRRLDTLTQQTATGQVADTYAGLGAGARVSLDLRPRIAEANAYASDIDQATDRMQATQSVLGQLDTIASRFAADALNPSTLTAGGMATVAAQARDALAQVGSLLNAQVGGAYLFAGEDTANPPVTGSGLAAFAAQMQADVAALGPGGAAPVIAATKADAASSAYSPFSNTIGAVPPMMDAGEGQRVPVGVSAAQPYVGDLLRGLATLGALTDAQAQLGQPFLDMLAEVRTTLSGAAGAIGNDSSLLGARQDQLATAKANLSDTADALTKQVSGVEDVDMAATATVLSQVQTQLQASYQVLSRLNSLSLVNFLGSAA